MRLRVKPCISFAPRRPSIIFTSINRHRSDSTIASFTLARQCAIRPADWFRLPSPSGSTRRCARSKRLRCPTTPAMWPGGCRRSAPGLSSAGAATDRRSLGRVESPAPVAPAPLPISPGWLGLDLAGFLQHRPHGSRHGARFANHPVQPLAPEGQRLGRAQAGGAVAQQ